jgi:hypothetical protein
MLCMLGQTDAGHVPTGKLPLFDCSKVKKELGLDFIDIRKTAQDMAQSLIDMGILPRLPGAPASKL